MKIKQIKSSLENEIIKATSKACVKVSKRVCELFPKVLEVQPNITGITTGMGTWSFDGYAIASSTEEECKGE